MSSSRLSEGLPAIQNDENSTDRELWTWERPWAHRFAFLKNSGYLLRPRYRPGWTPSWTEGQRSSRFEDAIISERGSIMDAVRVMDGTVVIFKHVLKNSPEASISRMASSDQLRRDPSNHCVPLLDELEDPDDNDSIFLVFPLLRPIGHPPPESVGEAVDFVEQTLEGLAFLHANQIAHRDCAWGNIMMDGRALFPEGWHPMEIDRYYDGRYLASKRANNPSRTRVGGVRYFFIDFGISTIGQDQVVGSSGQERAPELSDTIPYDPFRLDIYILGKVFEYFLLKEYSNVAFLYDMVNAMIIPDPSQRPTATEALERFRGLKSQVPISLSKRLHHPEPEHYLTEFIRDTVYRIRDTYWRAYPNPYLPPLA